MKSRGCLLLIAIMSMSVLVGWGGKEVRLLDGGKLIDLDKAISFAKPGGLSGETDEESEKASEKAYEKDSEKTSEATAESPDIDIKNIVITVRGERIAYENGRAKDDGLSVNELAKRIRSDYAVGVQVTLMDDFAEAHVYKDVRESLDGLKEDSGLTYVEVMSWEGE